MYRLPIPVLMLAAALWLPACMSEGTGGSTAAAAAATGKPGDFTIQLIYFGHPG